MGQNISLPRGKALHGPQSSWNKYTSREGNFLVVIRFFTTPYILAWRVKACYTTLEHAETKNCKVVIFANYCHSDHGRLVLGEMYNQPPKKP